jgi:hypothetical protein
MAERTEKLARARSTPNGDVTNSELALRQLATTGYNTCQCQSSGASGRLRYLAIFKLIVLRLAPSFGYLPRVFIEAPAEQLQIKTVSRNMTLAA